MDSDKFRVYHMSSSSAPGNDGHIMAFGWATGAYGAQIYVDTDPTGNISLRQRGGDGTWTPWRTIYHSGNLSVNNASLTL